MTGFLFDTGELRREAILRRLGYREIIPIKTAKRGFDMETRNRITDALAIAEEKAVEAGLLLAECGEYDAADAAADLYEQVFLLKSRIKKMETEGEE